MAAIKPSLSRRALIAGAASVPFLLAGLGDTNSLAKEAFSHPNYFDLASAQIPRAAQVSHWPDQLLSWKASPLPDASFLGVRYNAIFLGVTPTLDQVADHLLIAALLPNRVYQSAQFAGLHPGLNPDAYVGEPRTLQAQINIDFSRLCATMEADSTSDLWLVFGDEMLASGHLHLAVVAWQRARRSAHPCIEALNQRVSLVEEYLSERDLRHQVNDCLDQADHWVSAFIAEQQRTGAPNQQVEQTLALKRFRPPMTKRHGC